MDVVYLGRGCEQKKNKPGMKNEIVGGEIPVELTSGRNCEQGAYVEIANICTE